MDPRLNQATLDRLNGVYYYTDEELEQRRLDHNQYHRAYRQLHRAKVNKQALDNYYRNKAQITARRRELYRERKLLLKPEVVRSDESN
jgi:hypothetical protein